MDPYRRWRRTIWYVSSAGAVLLTAAAVLAALYLAAQWLSGAAR